MTDNEAMFCTIFKGNKEPELYVYVPWKTGAGNIPEELQQRMGTLREVMTLSLDPGKKLARANARNVLKDIREKGYYLQLPPDITGQVLFDGD